MCYYAKLETLLTDQLIFGWPHSSVPARKKVLVKPSISISLGSSLGCLCLKAHFGYHNIPLLGRISHKMETTSQHDLCC